MDFLRGFGQDVRFASRMIRRRLGFTTVAVLTLAVGIGATTSMFSVINGVLLKPLPYSEPESLVQMWERLPRYENASVAWPNFLDWREQNTVFEEVAGFKPIGMNLTGVGDPAELLVYQLSASMFDLLGVQPLLGRTFFEEEDQVGGDPVVVLTHWFWQTRFGGDENVIGRSITLDDLLYTVVGVMPRSFVFPPLEPQTDLWVPVGRFATEEDGWFERQNHNALQVIGRLRPGVTIERARGDMETIALRLEEEYPASNTGNRVNMESMYERALGDMRRPLMLLFCGVAFVLLIACANVANLLLARSAARQREIAVRSSVGAAGGRIVRLLLTESVMLWLLGGLGGLLVAYGGTRLLSSWLGGTIPRAGDVRIDGLVLLFVLAVSLLTGVVFGLAPALRSTRLDLQESLKEGAKGSGGAKGGRMRRGLVIAEVMLAQALLIVAGLTIHSFLVLSNESPGLDARNLLTVRISLPTSKYPELAGRQAFFSQLLERVQGLPGVVSAAAGGPLPFTPLGGWQSGYVVEGETPPEPGQMPIVETAAATAEYHRTLGIPLLRGRLFSEGDRADAPPVAIIDETFAARHWPNANPIGQRIRLIGRFFEVVGVVGHVKNRGIANESLVQMYIPFEWDNDDTWSLAIKTETEPMLTAAAVRNAVLELDPTQPVSFVRAMQRNLESTVMVNRIQGVLLGAFAAAALLLATVGIYGVMSHATNERRHEIGIRMAVGASRGEVLRLVVRQGLVLIAIGVPLGLGLAMAVGRLMSSELYGITTFDPTSLILAPLLLGSVAVLASYVPAHRASVVDPVETLRTE
jgi:putative ABC transport system permease protein